MRQRVSSLFWIDEFRPGELALAARPRGGDWLPDEIANWRRSGIDAVLSLLIRQEERDLQLTDESQETRSQGLEFLSFPIPDRDVPTSETKLAQLLQSLDQKLSSGKKILVHCRQGIGRSGLVAACLLVKRGMSPGAAVEKISHARGVPVPETLEQREWIDHFAAALTK
jgi:protein-tyrosine phosphatase